MKEIIQEKYWGTKLSHHIYEGQIGSIRKRITIDENTWSAWRTEQRKAYIIKLKWTKY